jgi:lipopolysaccharide export system protein LptC
MDRQTASLAMPGDIRALTILEAGRRRATVFKRARRHSLLVKLLRLTIPAGSVLAVAGAVTVLIGARMAETPPVIDPARAGIEGGKITMRDPRLLGFQKDNRSYQVTADKARQEIKTPNLVELAQPNARVETQTSIFAHIQAAAGLFDTAIEKLNLDKDIRIVTDDGYTLNLKDAQIDMKRGDLVSNKDVRLEMNNGRINAKAIDLQNNGAIVNFSGGVSSEFTNLFNLTPASKSPGEGAGQSR